MMHCIFFPNFNGICLNCTGVGFKEKIPNPPKAPKPQKTPFHEGVCFTFRAGVSLLETQGCPNFRLVSGTPRRGLFSLQESWAAASELSLWDTSGSDTAAGVTHRLLGYTGAEVLQRKLSTGTETENDASF